MFYHISDKNPNPPLITCSQFGHIGECGSVLLFFSYTFVLLYQVPWYVFCLFPSPLFLLSSPFFYFPSFLLY